MYSVIINMGCIRAYSVSTSLSQCATRATIFRILSISFSKYSMWRWGCMWSRGYYNYI